MSIRDFNDLLQAARQEAEPQRLLFLFAKAEAMRGGQKTNHHSGSITPVMCVDKLPEELTSFESLVKEADAITDKWDFILIGGLAGKNGLAPSSLDADPLLHKMSNDLAAGRDLSAYAVMDRQQRPIIVT